MTIGRKTLETARREGVPFRLHVADGRQFKIANADEIRIGKTHVVVFDRDTNPRILPYLMLTGIDYLRPGKARSKQTDA